MPVSIEAPRSKLQGIFDPQGGFLYSKRSLTPQQDFGELSRAATGNALAPGFKLPKDNGMELRSSGKFLILIAP
jgi:hypothetical protein